VVAGVADPAESKVMAFQERFRAARTEPSVQLINAPDIDVVHVCTPNASHVPLAEAAIRAGKHVVCEKPLATSSAEAARLVELAHQAEVVAAVPFVYRYYPTIREIRERVRTGRVGELTVVHGSYLQDWLAKQTDNDWRVDSLLGGASRAFADIGVHWVDLFEFVTGQRIKRLTARLRTVFPSRQGAAGPVKVETEDVATLSFETDGGVVGCVVISQVSHGRKNRIWISLDGTGGSLTFDHEQPDVLWVGGRAANQVIPQSLDAFGTAAGRFVTLPPGHPQGWQGCFNAFVADVYASLDGDNPDGMPRFEDGWRGAVVTEAVLKAAREKCWVEVDQ
jgi:predicted dehydrogenase